MTLLTSKYIVAHPKRVILRNIGLATLNTFNFRCLNMKTLRTIVHRTQKIEKTSKEILKMTQDKIFYKFKDIYYNKYKKLTINTFLCINVTFCSISVTVASSLSWFIFQVRGKPNLCSIKFFTVLLTYLKGQWYVAKHGEGSLQKWQPGAHRLHWNITSQEWLLFSTYSVQATRKMRSNGTPCIFVHV